MPLLYSSVLFNNSNVSQYYTSFDSSSTSNVIESLISISKHILSTKNANIFVKNNFLCGIIVICDNFHIICFASKDFSTHQMNSFLNTSSNEIIQYTNAKISDNTIKIITDILKEKMEYYNNPENDKIKKIKSHLDETRITILDNIDLAIQRGDRINELCEHSNLLIQNAETFETNSKKLKCALLCKNIKFIILFSIVLIIAAIAILFSICNPNFSKCKKQN